MQTSAYPVTPLRQIAIILAHCILRIRNKRLTDYRVSDIETYERALAGVAGG